MEFQAIGASRSRTPLATNHGSLATDTAASARPRAAAAAVDEFGEQFAAAIHVVLAVQGLHVDVDRVLAEREVSGDLLLAVAGQQALERLPEARRELELKFGV